jgi:uncharacterized Ntn-hydrolase superfamily protein
MTYSIVARDPETGWLGIAVASRFFAVGAIVPHIRAEAAVATQAFINPLWGVEGVARLSDGAGAAETLAAMTARDRGAAHRQCHVIDAWGRTTAHTGAACVDWAGHAAAEGVSVAGNMLAGPEVVSDTLAAWTAAAEAPFPERFLIAMRAGEAAGGDKRGRQSAALRVHRGEDYPWIDLRVDDHADPLAELERLLAVAGERYLTFAETLGRRADFTGDPDRSRLERLLADLDRERFGLPSHSRATP